jgi:hypothetical protein
MVLVAVHADAQTKTTAGAFTVETPTLLSLGFDWTISGDDNRNASVAVSYRRKGETAWKKGLPLLRLQRERVNGGPPLPTDNPLVPRFPFDYVVPNMFSGSVLNLAPDTEYECRFVMTDPDGVTGTAARTVTVRTRREPMPAAGGKTYHVYPVDWKGSKQEPALPDKSDPQRLYRPEGLDFGLRAGSVAVDAGVELPTITDGFTGKAPDIGAFETGKPLPHYGPRN